jgi:DNA-binding MarR family transcriptional regulator
MEASLEAHGIRKPDIRLPGTLAPVAPNVPTQPRISYVVARLDRAVRHELDEQVRRFGLRWPQYTALSVLAARGGLSNAQLARRSYVTPQSMNELIAGLEECGLVRRVPDPGHARIRIIELTAPGTRLLAKCDSAVSAMEERMLDGLPRNERDRMRALLTTCVHNLGAGL